MANDDNNNSMIVYAEGSAINSSASDGTMLDGVGGIESLQIEGLQPANGKIYTSAKWENHPKQRVLGRDALLLGNSEGA